LGQYHGFSLVEIIMALGLVAVSVIGILSVFPAALDTARDSKAETRVTYIAQGLISELMTGNLSQVKIAERRQSLDRPYNGDLSDSNANPISAYRTLDLTTTQTVYLLFDQEGAVLRAATNSEYANGIVPSATETPAVFLAKLTSEYGNAFYPANLALIRLSVETPAATVEAKRKKYAFATLRGDT
jgi:type II secretory pathway pseudopilin PulG